MKLVAKSLLHLEFLDGDCDSRLKQPQELLLKPQSSCPPTPCQAKSKMREKKAFPLFITRLQDRALFFVSLRQTSGNIAMWRFLEKSWFFLGEISSARKNRDFSRCSRKIGDVFHTAHSFLQSRLIVIFPLVKVSSPSIIIKSSLLFIGRSKIFHKLFLSLLHHLQHGCLLFHYLL